jgi:tetratricopeptide (TPR) repeat protein
MKWKRVGVLIGAVVIAVGPLYWYWLSQERARLRVNEARSRAARMAPRPKPNCPWRWRTEAEWAVHHVVRNIASWTLSDDKDGTPAAQVRVRRTATKTGVDTFAVELVTAADTRQFAITPAAQPWEASAYAGVSSTLLGAMAVGSQVPPTTDIHALLLSSDTKSLRQADKILSAALGRHPRDARLHEQAALLWSAYALRETDDGRADDRPFLNGIVAHLAIADALRSGQPRSEEGAIATVVLDALLLRQVDAYRSLDKLTTTYPGPTTAAWKTALQLRITKDPRLMTRGGKYTRLEKLEGLRAVEESLGCRATVEAARAWSLPPAADWVRVALRHCPASATPLTNQSLALQIEDAARAIEAQPGRTESAIEAVASASRSYDPQARRPSSVVPVDVRADAAVRHITTELMLRVRHLQGLGLPEQARQFASLAVETHMALPQGPLVALVLQNAVQTQAPRTCAAVARLVADRPDIVPPSSWGEVQRCRDQNLLAMVDGWMAMVAIPATGRIVRGPWVTGLKMAGPTLAELRLRAPWSADVAWDCLLMEYHGNPPSAAVLDAYAKLLDYDVYAMEKAVRDISDRDDDLQRLAEHICEADVERCAEYAERVANVDREQPAEKMWKRALAGAQDRIQLSNWLGVYVNILFDRGATSEALRVAKEAADIYSQMGLFTLGFVYERLGRFDEAVAQYAKITERYQDKKFENAFYVRYRQRYGDSRFREEAERATAELFPSGLVRRTLDELQREGHMGLLPVGQLGVAPKLQRAGMARDDRIAAVDGFVVLNDAQFGVVITFTDDPALTVIVQRGSRFVEVKGHYRRWKYGPVPRPAGQE